MEYIIVVGLTTIATYSIIKVMARKSNKMFGKVLYRQSDMHNVLNKVYPLKQPRIEKKEKSYCKFKDSSLDTVRVIISDDKAYWIFNNIFYIAQTDDGDVLPETAEPINTSNLSKEEMSKMLSILDSLISGGSNDSGGSGK
jgi:hypothetical protein